MICFPNAKINLGLNIVARRPDGYHDIETVFYPIPLRDALEVVRSESNEPYRFFESGLAIDGNAEQNLVIRAWHLLANQHDLPPTDIHLMKHIPFGAGMGGGSADAASMLLLLNDYYRLNHSKAELAEMATSIGADCPFFVYNAPMYATEIGDKLEPIDMDLSPYILVVVKPDTFVSTKDAYAAVIPHQPTQSLKEVIAAPIHTWREGLKNDFERSVFQKFPHLADIKQGLYDKGAVYASMSGSGSSIFGLFDILPNLDDFRKDYFVWTTND